MAGGASGVKGEGDGVEAGEPDEERVVEDVPGGGAADDEGGAARGAGWGRALPVRRSLVRLCLPFHQLLNMTVVRVHSSAWSAPSRRA